MIHQIPSKAHPFNRCLIVWDEQKSCQTNKSTPSCRMGGNFLKQRSPLRSGNCLYRPSVMSTIEDKYLSIWCSPKKGPFTAEWHSSGMNNMEKNIQYLVTKTILQQTLCRKLWLRKILIATRRLWYPPPTP